MILEKIILKKIIFFDFFKKYFDYYQNKIFLNRININVWNKKLSAFYQNIL